MIQTHSGVHIVNVTESLAITTTSVAIEPNLIQELLPFWQ